MFLALGGVARHREVNETIGENNRKNNLLQMDTQQVGEKHQPKQRQVADQRAIAVADLWVLPQDWEVTSRE